MPLFSRRNMPTARSWRVRVQLRIAVVGLLPLLFLSGCQFLGTTPTPPPGWRSPVSNLLIDDTSIPSGWIAPSPSDTSIDPTANRVYRIWMNPLNSGKVLEQIWRSYTVADAKAKYSDLVRTQYAPNGPLPANTFFVAFQPPAEISMQANAADDFYLACGWWGVAYCQAFARYRNYVIQLQVDRELTYQGHTSEGVTDADVGTLLSAMNSQASQVLATIALQPSP
jgi:hypothetical protein